jgi:hypothetical protein
VVTWINKGIYDFHTLPKSMKCLITKENEDKIFEIQNIYAERDSDELLNKLIGLEEVLIHCECYFINDIDNIKEVAMPVVMIFD